LAGLGTLWRHAREALKRSNDCIASGQRCEASTGVLDVLNPHREPIALPVDPTGPFARMALGGLPQSLHEHTDVGQEILVRFRDDAENTHTPVPFPETVENAPANGVSVGGATKGRHVSASGVTKPEAPDSVVERPPTAREEQACLRCVPSAVLRAGPQQAAHQVGLHPFGLGNDRGGAA